MWWHLQDWKIHQRSTKNSRKHSKLLNTIVTWWTQTKSKFILHLNIASLPRHIDEFKTLLSTLDHNIDVITLTEILLVKQ